VTEFLRVLHIIAHPPPILSDAREPWTSLQGCENRPCLKPIEFETNNQTRHVYWNLQTYDTSHQEYVMYLECSWTSSEVKHSPVSTRCCSSKCVHSG